MACGHLYESLKRVVEKDSKLEVLVLFTRANSMAHEKFDKP